MEDNIVTLQTFLTIGEAEVAKSLLASFGVSSQIAHEDLINTLTTVYTGQVGIQLLVNEKDVPRAREIIAAKFDHSELDAAKKD